MGSCTRTWRPPSLGATSVMVPRWALTIASTMESPRPTPVPSFVRSGPARRKGSTRPATSPGSTTGPVFVTSSSAALVVTSDRDRDGAAGDVVPDGVFDEVAGEPFEQSGIAAHHDRLDVC